MKYEFLNRIYKLKTALLAAVSFATGVALLALARYVSSTESLASFSLWPIGEIGGTLAAAGIFGIAWDFLDSRDREAREDERIRRLLSESAPAFRDAVVRGFAVGTDDLRRVATPAMLDQIATNALSLRLGDEQFAREIYADVRDQAVRAPERWAAVEADVRLSTATADRGAVGAPRFEVLVAWEYTVVPSHPVARFACVSDRDEFYELTRDVPATSTWFMTPRPGFDASKRECFELLSYSIDGIDQKIRRSERRTGQTYSVTLGEDLVREGRPVRIRHVYRAVAAKSNHQLFLEVAQPAKDVSMTIDYTATDISRLTVSDLVTSIHKPRIARMPATTAAKVVQVDIPGWLLPRAGFTAVWTLESGEHESPSSISDRTSSERAERSSRAA